MYIGYYTLHVVGDGIGTVAKVRGWNFESREWRG